MTKKIVRRARTSVQIQSTLLSILAHRDLFASLRTEAELAAMVTKLAKKTDRPYAALLGLLVGTSADLDEQEGRALWLDAVANRRAMAARLGRAVHLRVAALDLLMTRATSDKRPPVLVPAGLVQDALGVLSIDPLTGLLTRDHFRLVADHELRQRVDRPVVIAYLDLDDFKQLNDQRGHAYGDKVLRALAEAWRTHARAGDPMARLGGDEFAALFTDCPPDQAKEVLLRVKRALRESTREQEASFSFGLAVAEPGVDLNALLERADHAMYAMKNDRGRSERRSAPRGRPPILVCASRRMDSLFELQRAVVDWGGVFLPVAADKAPLLCRITRPNVMLADVMTTPHGAGRLLASVRAAGPDIQTFLLVPAQWKGRSVGKLGAPGLAWPSDASVVARFLRATLGPRREPYPPSVDIEQLRAVRLAVGALVDGKPLAPSVLDRLAGRLEIDLLRRFLGS